MKTPRYLCFHTVNEVLTDLLAIARERSINSVLDDDATEHDGWRAIASTIEDVRARWDVTAELSNKKAYARIYGPKCTECGRRFPADGDASICSKCIEANRPNVADLIGLEPCSNDAAPSQE